MGYIKPQKAFEADYKLVKKYGNYQNYKEAMENASDKINSESKPIQEITQIGNSLDNTKNQNSNYTMDDVVNYVENGESKPEKSTEIPKTAYDTYMSQALDLYNKGIEANNKMADNQASAVGSEYRELQRNVNELNKANGKINTGYVGDTSIEGYNAYRNSLNDIYTQRNKSNNDLYSYYVDSMLKAQQAKEKSELAQKEIQLTEDANQLEKDKYVSTQISALLNIDDALDYSGKIKSDYANKVRNYIEEYYGSYENAPASIKFELSSYPGWDEYLNAYNNNEQKYSNVESKLNTLMGIANDNTIVSADTPNANKFAVVNADLSEQSSQIRGGVGQNNFRATINGTTYKLETGKLSERLEGATADKIKEKIKEIRGRDAKEGDFVYYNDKVYVVANNGQICLVRARAGKDDDYNNFVNAIKNGIVK